jgi:hypothetical protein
VWSCLDNSVWSVGIVLVINYLKLKDEMLAARVDCSPFWYSLDRLIICTFSAQTAAGGC